MRNLSTLKNTEIQQLNIEGESFYKITNVDELRPFFMSIVSDSNHWMFISSNGGLSAGRKNAEHSLFPYYTDDKITEFAEVTGSKSIFLIDQPEKKKLLWEPFSIRHEGVYEVTRNLYKNIYGNKILFEEINHDLNLVFSYQWNSSNQFGFVRKSKLENIGNQKITITLLDGIQNILPAGVGPELQNQTSNLVDAYKRSELIKESGLGIYALSAYIVDKAEPSESLKANIVWSLGLEKPTYLLSSLQLRNFRRRYDLKDEVDIKAEKGAYFISDTIHLSPQAIKKWLICADVNKNHSSIVELSTLIKEGTYLKEVVEQDVEIGTEKLIKLIASSDGLQFSGDQFRDVRHFSNTLFNIMRGGIFDKNYQIEKWDFTYYLLKANIESYNNNLVFINNLPDVFSFFEMKKILVPIQDPDLKRLGLEYLPLSFSRRHGDPSRPWNKFSINTRNETDGSKILDYEGNWRDIFQNWEALVHAYPAFIESMVLKFLNASTFEGYNPYRVTKSGFDWETIEPDNPWSYIGYWGDHQIIYLLKFLEFFNNYSSTRLSQYFDKEIFVYANVPYKIKSFSDILSNPKDTILFDEELDMEIRNRKKVMGGDGALLENKKGIIHRVNFIEKILATLLSKISNFIPEGGIWMNTQRPEWNDANNALVGNGVSMVTLYYTRRFLVFFKEILNYFENSKINISEELLFFFGKVKNVLEENKALLKGTMDDGGRNLVLNGLGEAGSQFRNQIYRQSFSGGKEELLFSDLKEFIDLSIEYAEHTIRSNRREDDLFHAYNLMSVVDGDKVMVSRLSEMLEGQVAVLSSGYLSAKSCLGVLDGLKKSRLFRDDQYSYLLYPNKRLKGFMEKNNIPEKSVRNSKLIHQLIQDGIASIVQKDIKGGYHFNGTFNNANDLETALDHLSLSGYGELVKQEKPYILKVFEEVFNHKEFTGRSGTFFGYEGLGSIYWHMVSKLQLAVQECCLKAIGDNEDPMIVGRLLEHYYEINEGIGIHKSPQLYGAFPTDPYSHTPAGKGAQQPGMTGQVKEDILSRYGELGVFIKEGALVFNPCLLRKSEFLKESKEFRCIDVDGVSKNIQLEAGQLFFTFCQVPIIYQLSDFNQLDILDSKGEVQSFNSLKLNKDLSEQIFERRGSVEKILVKLQQDILK